MTTNIQAVFDAVLEALELEQSEDIQTYAKERLQHVYGEHKETLVSAVNIVAKHLNGKVVIKESTLNVSFMVDFYPDKYGDVPRTVGFQLYSEVTGEFVNVCFEGLGPSEVQVYNCDMVYAVTQWMEGVVRGKATYTDEDRHGWIMDRM